LATTPRVIADIFECDENNNPISDTSTPRRIGYEVKICVKPNTPTRNRDVFVKSFENFAFFKNQGAAIQQIVGDTEEVNERLTLVLCIPGAEVCSFKTKLRKEFFYSRGIGNITGVGEIGMQFGPLAIITNAVNDFAGFASVNIIIPIRGEAPGRAKFDEDGNIKYNWWYDSPWWLRLLIILGAIILFLICVCICLAACCWYGGCCENEEIKTRRKLITQRIVETYERRNPPPEEQQFEPEAPVEAKKKHKSPRHLTLEETPHEDDDDDDDGPDDEDVCFDAEEHPGTVVFETVLDQVVADNLNKKYGPPIYRAVKKQLPSRRFFVCDNEEQPDEWRQIDKQELIDEIGRAFTDAQQALKNKKKAEAPKPSRFMALTNG
jgi:hypothetical protein